MLDEFREEQNQELAEIITEERKQDAEDLKQLNEMGMDAYLPKAEASEEGKTAPTSKDEEPNDGPVEETSASNAKVDYMEQIRQAREQAVMEFKFAEEETLQKMAEEKKATADEERATDQKPVILRPPRPNSAQKNLKVKQKTQKPTKQRNEFE